MSLFEDNSEIEGVFRSYRPYCGVSCTQCEHCNTPKMSLLAPKRGGIMFVADEPTKGQDASGNVFTGAYKALLNQANRYEYPEDKLSFCFVAACHGVGLSKLREQEAQVVIDACHDELFSCIEQVHPSVIVPLSETAWKAVHGSLTGRLDGMTYASDVCFELIPDQTLHAWVAPILSPLELRRLEEDRKTKEDFVFYARKMQVFMRRLFTEDLSKFPDYSAMSKSIEVCDDPASAVQALRTVLADCPEYLAFDYETEGIKLEREDMHIVCVGLAYDRHTYAMPFFRDDEEFVSLFKSILSERRIGKIAHHAKYEARVSLAKLGVLPSPWAWDSMYGARLLNNKRKCGLKPQVYVNFGISGYDRIERYIETPVSEDELDKWGNNHRNILMDAFLHDPDVHATTLQYVGQDALYTLHLALRQMDAVCPDEHLSKGERLFRSLINPLVKAEVNGMVVDRNRVQENIEECTKILAAVKESISNDPLVKEKWNEDVEGHPFDFNKSSDLGHLLYELAGQKEERTAKGEYALDSETLERMPFPITDSILEARRIAKIRDTYLVNLKKESVLDTSKGDYVLHANFNLHVADTFRSSSSGGINLQNLPAHDKRANNLIRSCILPAKGAMIIGSDYKALEVSIGCSIHHDRNMLAFLESNGDMHRATTKDIFRLSDEDIETMDKGLFKTIRGYGKRTNFSAFYGAGFSTVGNTCWKNANYQPQIMEHLKSVGLGDYNVFMDHIKGVCERLWTEQFPEYGKWKEDIYEFYKKHGYVDLVDGFRCYGPLSYMQAGNAPIQGPASHVLLWGLTRIDKELEQRHMRSHIINQIHDAVYLNCYPEEFEEVKAIERKWLVDEAPNRFPWISAPLASELEYTKVREDGGNWAEMEEFGYI